MLKHQFVSTYGSSRRKRLSPLALIGISVPLVLALIATAIVVILPRLNTHAAGNAAGNMDCTLIVPANPLSAQGLATPYQLVATNPANGACNEANKVQAAFVQGAVIDTATGQISVYNPLVVDQGTQPAVQPTVPTLPARSVVALWFGFNGGNLTLQSTNNSLQQGGCVNGVNGSIFGQFAYCNAPRFFASANLAMRRGQLVPPALGMASDGKTCPTVRDFSVVDMDQSDNVPTQYILNGKGQVAQLTAANTATLTNAGNGVQMQTPQLQVNASDNRLLDVALDGAMGCHPWMVPDLADPGHMVPALPLNELQAAKFQAAPVAVVPANDPLVVVNGQPNLNKINAYRRGVNQPRAASLNAASTTTYCTNLLSTAPARLQLDMQTTQNRPSPDAAVATNLFTFLGQRFAATFGANGLNCVQLLNKPNPVTVTVDGNGVATAATINANGAVANGGTATLTVNGTATQFANGQAQVTVNKLPTVATVNGAAVSITDGANNAQNNNAQNGQNNAQQPVAVAATLMVNGTAVQFTNGQAQVTINKLPATATLNGTAITITDGANNGGGNNGGANTTATLTVNGTATQFANGQAQVTVNKLPAAATVNGAAVSITDGANNAQNNNGQNNVQNVQNNNGQQPVAIAAATLTVNGTAVQFANGQAQITVNKLPATATLNGTAITITDGANNAGGNNGGANTTTTLTVNGAATQFANGQAQVTVNKLPATAAMNGAAVSITDGANNVQNGQNNAQNNNGQQPVATPTTLTVNGTAVQFTNGQAQVTINKLPATATLNGTTITITDGANNAGGNNGGTNTTGAITFNINGQTMSVTPGQSGTATINNQTVTLTVSADGTMVTITNANNGGGNNTVNVPTTGQTTAMVNNQPATLTMNDATNTMTVTTTPATATPTATSVSGN